MVLYDFKCPKCNHLALDVFTTAKATPACGKCGEKMQRLYAKPAIKVYDAPFWPNLLPEHHDLRPGRTRLNYAGISLKER